MKRVFSSRVVIEYEQVFQFSEYGEAEYRQAFADGSTHAKKRS